MRTSSANKRTFHRALILIPALVFLLSACGANTGSGTGSSGGTGAAPGTTPVPKFNSTGCPSSTAVANAPAANVLVKAQQANTTITAHNGDVIEIQLPFGHQWGGPSASQGQLELQTPYGYVSQANSACVWRFVAKGTGTTSLTFTSRALCKPGQLCPQYIMELPFTIDVK